MTVIKVENLGKKYIIGHDRKAEGAFRYNSMRDTIAHTMRGMYQRIRHPLSLNRENTKIEEFWALKDINFEINQGDRVGIIGHNGAGKTTLLKLLSRITSPTTGKIKIKGRIASLLEVGTGFHPELTGRENIYLNGAILGMKRDEIKKKFDEIVAFAEVEKFLDTPVKRYSSGMYVRLAFAVAAHLEPEILIVDEVLAVGDAAFQKKSLGKMDDVSRKGRTVIFVSHNMLAIRKLCTSGLYIKKGLLIKSGPIDDCVNDYMTKNLLTKKSSYFNKKDIQDSIHSINLLNKRKENISEVRTGEQIIFEINLNLKKRRKVVLNVGIYNNYGEKLFHLSSLHSKELLDIGSDTILGIIEKNPLPPGEYSANFSLFIDSIRADHVQHEFLFRVIEGNFFLNGNEHLTLGSKIMVESFWRKDEKNH